MTPISFKANFIRDTYIKQVVTPDTSKDKKVALVELDINHKNDISALKAVARDWDSRAFGYAGCIYDDAIKTLKYPDTKEHYYALTTQKEDYKNLDPKKILGLTLFSDKKFSKNELNWLQVEPDCSYSHSGKYRTYKNVGKALVNFVKEISDKTISVYPARNATPFYRKLGFEKETSKYPTLLFKK